VAFVSGSLEHPINRDYRLKGYKQALKKAGIRYDDKLVFETDYTYKAGQLLQPALQSVGATAAIVGDDELAAGVMNGVSDAGLSVPNDFEIITSNDTKLTEMVRPKMSSITQPLYDIGAVAMRLLTKLMNNEQVDEKTILLPYGLMKRDSTN
jgi:LacI family transcriptional regulator